MAVATYVVPGVPLIPQDLGMACWYASTQMLIKWRRDQTQSTESDLPDPGELDETIKLYKANNGLPLARMRDFGKMMGLVEVPPVCPSLDAIANWLSDYGPLWTAGLKVTPTKSYGHVVVIAGVGADELYVLDPEPLNVGTREWKPQEWLATTLSIAVNANVAFNFLRLP
jgi:hypothetical protein